MSRRGLAALLAAVLALGLAGCGKKGALELPKPEDERARQERSGSRG